MQQQILYADSFVNNSIEVQGCHKDRINTILNETFQLTVRQHIYGEDDDDIDGFRELRSPQFEQAKTPGGSSQQMMGRPLEIKSKILGKVEAKIDEQLSQIDEEEEKRMAHAF